jgi:tetratricopeptide (TPR) repeat protein
MAGEEALWYYKRGAARTALGHSADAELDLRKALAFEGRKWVHGRAHLEIGKLMLQAGKRSAAASELRTAISLCEEDGDPLAAAEARALLPSPPEDIRSRAHTDF